MKKSFLLLSLSLFLLTKPAAADDGGLLNFRTTGGMGAWIANFRQTDQQGHSTDLSSATSLAIDLSGGLNFGNFFVEYAPTLGIANYLPRSYFSGFKDTSATRRDASYYSLLGANVGLSWAGNPFEPFFGLEYGHMGFSAGSETDYSGISPRLGLRIWLGNAAGIKFEFRRLLASSDDSGALPSGVSTHSDVWSIVLFGGAR